MRFRNLFFSLCCMATLGVSLVACSEDEDLFDDSGSKVTLPVHRAFILNEGTQGANNATLSFYAPDGNADFIKDIFYTQNQAKLGDTGQSMIEYNNDLYAIIAGSRYLVRMNTAGVEKQRYAIPESEGDPRYLAADDGYIYMTQYGGQVTKLDANTLKVVGTFKGGANLEGIAECDGKLYVANSYLKNDAGYQYQTDLFVINAANMQLETTLAVDINPNQVLEEDGKIFLIDWEYAGMQDPHIDVAMFCLYSLYNKRQVDCLIAAYFTEGCDDATKIKIYCYIAVCGLLWSNWCEYKRRLGVEFGEYSLRQYRYAKEYFRIVQDELEKDEKRQEKNV